ncbi:MAG: tRNA dihydrouridine(20/20a) synthase DusA [Gammaproteobacteria bacterium]|nr:tRNA dihydrouridine(20/20a) synthase DusA [Gammaproteobacteria bacterium]
MLDRRFSVAPMMDWTDRHDRYFLRLIAPNALLYTEMVTTGALIHGDYNRFLAFDSSEHPVALQLGGSDPKALAHCAKMGEDYGYDEINLNVGCPSDRVKSGHFGACLMLSPDTVADCVAAMSAAVKIPVTVKCRIGVDEQDSYEELTHFIQKVAAAGCQVFVIHARKAWLNGLSPKQNREIPPLRYDVVRQIKQDFKQLTIVVNGGIKEMDAVDEHLQFVDGVMIGREAYTNPYFLAEIEKNYYALDGKVRTREAVIEAFIPYVIEQLGKKVKLSSMTRHILGLFQGQKGARAWRRHLSENAHKEGAGVDVLIAAMGFLAIKDFA